MATLRDLRSRIKGIASTQQITRAMKMVSAAKLRRATEAIVSARPYANKLSGLIGALFTEDDKLTNPFVMTREVKNELVVVITADRGLCGAFNTNIIKEATHYVDNLKKEGINPILYCVGKKGYDHFRKRDYNLSGNLTGLFNSLNFSYVSKILPGILKDYLAGQYDRVTLIYNEFKTVVSQKVVSAQFLPIPLEVEEGMSGDLFIFEPSQKEILNTLLPQYLETNIWKSLLDSNAAEFGARMTAMENATTNASEMISSLKLTYNKARQAAITKELLEVVSGANALKG
ncbi:MAG: ATP synthase F1 subunit gamma [Ignavibacteriales bacterium]|mgnify:CR=1 FL=1|nr:MAG: ATP synthase F1 subunit gamma [Ignavibacteriaceae bacterium]MBW7873969.1 ATP synthase F1 subunit gamma [Ignavibacteria bacterium]MCZ2143272.1 ATP synthase F1 subunit gamma [Ignavibacteriales bacterium]OQY77249.1 MAG: ATP synthase F1 subunit gamma [Ignavibacteriales bacterium UTCHB3]MBV6444154.1 ATP synthase gamma chain [Ignavibacteriaceae bacterium]